jgi:tetratricopeptide (TPR) repeat protein
LSDPADPIAAVARQKRLGLVHLIAGNFAEAASICTDAAERARALGLYYDVASNLHNVGDAKLRLGELGAARAALSESLEVTERSGYERLAKLNRTYLTFLDGLEGAPEARAFLEANIAAAEAKGYITEVIEGEWLLATLLSRRGERAEARSRFERLLVLAQRFGQGLSVLTAVKALAAL